MYSVGDLVVYGSTGVCRVGDITTLDVQENGNPLPYYILEPLEQNGTISVPVDSTHVFLRAVISKEEAEALVDMIPTLTGVAHNSRANGELEEHYKTFFRSHNCEDLIKVTMSIYAKRQEAIGNKRKLGMVDERYMKHAEDLLFGELSAALGIAKDAVPNYIAQRVAVLAAE